jgi:hypothetical protein
MDGVGAIARLMLVCASLLQDTQGGLVIPQVPLFEVHIIAPFIRIYFR